MKRTLKEVITELKDLKNKYEDLKGLTEDRIRDDQIVEAQQSFGELLKVNAAIIKMENTEINMPE